MIHRMSESVRAERNSRDFGSSRNDITHERIEEGNELLLDFDKILKISKDGEPVLPVVVQHAQTLEVLILAYVNRTALERSMEIGQAVFYSTSRNELWHKGATSGDYLKLQEIRVNCEQNSLLFLVIPEKGGVCHTKDSSGNARRSCYYRSLELEGRKLRFL
jgi:phosphoribosyl-AMP cyclohydrolase